MSPSFYLDSFMVDDLENLTGPWDSYPFNRGEEDVVDDLEAIEDDLGATVEGVSNTVEAKEGELPTVPFEIPAASFGSIPGTHLVSLAPARRFSVLFVCLFFFSCCTLCCSYYNKSYRFIPSICLP